jgi:hypothetical protein
MTVPSIKGTAYGSVHEDLSALVADGRVSRDELEARLGAEDLKHFDAKVLAGNWYPIQSYRALLAIVADKEANGNAEEYLVARGWRAAARLKESGIYRQLEANDAASGKPWGARVAGLIGSVSRLMYNFTSWHVEPGEDATCFRAVVADAADFVDECRYTAQGFVAFAATMIAGAPVQVTSVRSGRDKIIYTVRRTGVGGSPSGS